ncbi:hypothetical protein CBL_10346 [Carabus blaptoides fortunei]
MSSRILAQSELLILRNPGLTGRKILGLQEKYIAQGSKTLARLDPRLEHDFLVNNIRFYCFMIAVLIVELSRKKNSGDKYCVDSGIPGSGQDHRPYIIVTTTIVKLENIAEFIAP